MQNTTFNHSITLMRAHNTQMHDRLVERWAHTLTREGWAVFSNLPGHDWPPLVAGYIPDIYAQFGDIELVIEVETEDGYDELVAGAKRMTFKKWKEESCNRSFRVVTV